MTQFLYAQLFFFFMCAERLVIIYSQVLLFFFNALSSYIKVASIGLLILLFDTSTYHSSVFPSFHRTFPHLSKYHSFLLSISPSNQRSIFPIIHLCPFSSPSVIPPPICQPSHHLLHTYQSNYHSICPLSIPPFLSRCHQTINLSMSLNVNLRSFYKCLKKKKKQKTFGNSTRKVLNFDIKSENI